MTLWNKIVVGTKLLFSGFESATDYALKLLNVYFSTADVSANIQKTRTTVETVLGYLRKYHRFCPVGWVTHYDKLIVAIQTVSDAFADNKLKQEEIAKAKADIQAAIEEWMKD